MSASEWAAWSGVLTALAGILASLGGLYWQMRKQWLLHSANLVTALVEKFYSDPMAQSRAKFVALINEHRAGNDVTLAGNYGFGVLGFYEHLGHLVRRGAIDKVMVWNKFGWEIVSYYHGITKPRNLINELRASEGSHTHYEEFEYLYNEMLKIYEHRGARVYNDDGEVRWFASFIKQEMLSEKRVEAMGSGASIK